VKDEFEKKDGCGIPEVIHKKFLRGNWENCEVQKNIRCCGLESNWVLSE
jgi:hypothetical protein